MTGAYREPWLTSRGGGDIQSLLSPQPDVVLMPNPRQNSGSPQILIVEDDVRLAELVSEFLEDNGFVVAVESNGSRAIERILDENPDLVVLDVMLPGDDGFEVCRRVRPTYRGPILMLTARGDEIDQVVGLELGADDYVAKPASPRVLLARIKALLRRGAQLDGKVDRLRFDDIVIDQSQRMLTVGGEEVELTSAEFDLLWLLACSAGRVLSRQFILDSLRGIDYDGIDRSIDVRISKLRQKLSDDPKKPARIKTIRGVGYLFVKSLS